MQVEAAFIALTNEVNVAMGGTPIVAPQLTGFSLSAIQAGFGLFATRFNARFPTHTITAPTVATASLGDVQTAFDTLTASVNAALSGSLIDPLPAPVLGTLDKSLLQACCNAMARAVDAVVAPIKATLEGLNGSGDGSSALKDALLDHQIVLRNLNNLFNVAPEPAEEDLEREELLGQVQSLF